VEAAKSNIDNKPDVRKRLADLYYETGQFEQAAVYLNMVYESAQKPEDKQEILPRLLDACLKDSKLQRAAELTGFCLTQGDLDPNSTVAQSINSYFIKPPVGSDPNEFLQALVAIKIPQGRPKWQQQLKNWTNYLGKAKEADKPNQQSS
jgi:hypothetical protein